MALPIPDEHVSPGTPRDVVLNIALPLAFFACANAMALWWLSSHTLNLTTLLLETKWALVQRIDAPVDWLVVGDSSGNQGVDTSLLAQRLGGRALNLCTVGDMGLLDDLWMLEEHIRRAGPPGNLLVVHVYDTWRRDDRDMRDVLESFQPPLPDWRTREPAIEYDSGDLRDLLLSQYVLRWIPLYSQNASLRQLAMHPVAASAPSPFRFDASGFMPRETADPQAVTEDVARHQRRLERGDGFESSPINRKCLRRILELGASGGFPVYIVNAPVAEDLAASERFREHHADLQEFLAAETAGFPGARVVFAVPEAFPASQLENADHLTLEGARTYTQRLVESIEAAAGHSASKAP